ncbi:hypothetical protein EVAR_41305_1 [Eumeta japonica]|uniref:Uncharacterized protein n=1 Tax=Eumeta variegata TaxID=151549 RepID=A0A4C1X348_EUMVA|nr:hypothetical protein EVAR_41305_1 [Eumeta japonica]
MTVFISQAIQPTHGELELKPNTKISEIRIEVNASGAAHARRPERRAILLPALMPEELGMELLSRNGLYDAFGA